jgi:hypothetical protein
VAIFEINAIYGGISCQIVNPASFLEISSSAEMSSFSVSFESTFELLKKLNVKGIDK